MKSRMKTRTALCVAIDAMTFGLLAISALPATARVVDAHLNHARDVDVAKM
jgi:hypothetical protein